MLLDAFISAKTSRVTVCSVCHDDDRRRGYAAGFIDLETAPYAQRVKYISLDILAGTWALRICSFGDIRSGTHKKKKCLIL